MLSVSEIFKITGYFYMKILLIKYSNFELLWQEKEKKRFCASIG